MATTADLLSQAEQAYHNLMCGSAVATVVDSDGSRVDYTKADTGKLAQYIAGLQRQIASASPAVSRSAGPMGIYLL